MNTPRRQRPSLGVITGLAIAIGLDTLVQLSWKAAVSRTGGDASTLEMFRNIFHQPLMLGLGACFIAQFVNWIAVLGKADLSYAQPITALSYVLTCFGSVVLFHDHLPVQRMIGIGLILAGVWAVSMTEPRTSNPSETV